MVEHDADHDDHGMTEREAIQQAEVQTDHASENTETDHLEAGRWADDGGPVHDND